MMEIGILIALLLLLVGTLNYINTMAGSIQSRKLTFSIMESVGMSRKQVYRLLLREGLLYAGFSVFLTLTAGTVVTYCCFQSMNYMEIPFFRTGSAIALRNSPGHHHMHSNPGPVLQEAGGEAFYCRPPAGI